jgi:hypothetical protein
MMSTRADKLFVVDAVTAILLNPSAANEHPDAYNSMTLPRKIEDFELNFTELCVVFPRAMHYSVPADGTILAITNHLLPEAERFKYGNNTQFSILNSEDHKREYFFEFDKYTHLVETNCSAR